MNKFCLPFITVVLIIAGCTPSVQVSSTATSTITPAPSFTPSPTATKTATPIPMIEADGQQIPDPKATNPEFFDPNNSDSPIVKFANAFGIKPEEVGELIPEKYITANGQIFYALTSRDLATTSILNETGYPILLAEQNQNKEWIWSEATPAKIYNLNNSVLETTSPTYIFDNKGDTDPANDEWIHILEKPEFQKLMLESANRIFISGELNSTWVFSEFKKDDWDRILSDWDNIKANLDKKELPADFQYDWGAAQDLVNFAVSNGLKIRGGNLAWDDDVPEDFWSYSPDQAKKLLEFIVKTRVIRFGSQVDVWNILSEAVARTQYSPGFYTGKKLDPVTSVQLIAQFVKEVDPEVRLVYVESSVFENFPSPEFYKDYFAFIDTLLQKNVPIDALIEENNLWAWSPIDREKTQIVMDEAKKRNLQFEGGETTIALSSIYPGWPNRPPEVIVNEADLLFIQAKMAAELKEIYAANGIDSFGFGSLEDITGWQARIGYPDSKSTLSPNFEGDRKPVWYAFMAASLKSFK